jgi:hypothetical protein
MDIKAFMVTPLPRWVALLAVVGTSVTAAGSATYLTLKRVNKDFDERVAEEVEKTTQFYSALKKSNYPTPQEAVADLIGTEEEAETILKYRETVKEMSYSSDGETGLKEVVRNVWTNSGSWNLEEELRIRDKTKPYILDHDEFFESDLPSVTLCWYEDDETLADEQDELVPNPETIVGAGNLQRFGSGSRDPNVLYVHNPTYEVNYEIVKQTGSYAEQHYGFTDNSLKHENIQRSARTRKFPLNDE